MEPHIFRVMVTSRRREDDVPEDTQLRQWRMEQERAERFFREKLKGHVLPEDFQRLIADLKRDLDDHK